MTNGGGKLEKLRVDYVSKELGTTISPLQIVQSHTPLKVLGKNHAYDRILVVGGPDDLARHVALDYGFQDVILPLDIVNKDRSIAPHHRYTEEQLQKWALKEPNLDKPIEAIMVFNDPRDMGTDLQIVMDLLNSQGGVLGTRRNPLKLRKREEPAVPIIFSNNDFVWANDYPLPRFGQGAFLRTVEALYRDINHLKPTENLHLTILGKPYKIQYDFAHQVLINWRERLLAGEAHLDTELSLPGLHEPAQETPFAKIYMVGDNPESDIKGANDHGWESLLVRTGVYADAEWDTIVAQPTTGVFDDVLAGVQAVLQEQGRI